MWPDRVSNPGPLTYKSDAPPTALRGPARPDSYERLTTTIGFNPNIFILYRNQSYKILNCLLVFMPFIYF